MTTPKSAADAREPTPQPESPAASEAVPEPRAGSPEAALRAARAAFDAGDFRRAHALAAEATRSTDAAVREDAQRVLRRTQIDRVQIALFGLCLALFAGITYWYVLR